MKVLFLSRSYKHCRKPTLPERALLVKLYYCNSENAVAAVREHRRLKKQRRGPMSERALRHDSKIRENRTAMFSFWKRTKKNQHRRCRGYCYSGRGSKQ
ncbi:hypothetical protein TNCV_1382101 [Trichonephila clavipes]|nr:hypothetical protein TNCV_1382101 [Trichonephila clavipes]